MFLRKFNRKWMQSALDTMIFKFGEGFYANNKYMFWNIANMRVYNFGPHPNPCSGAFK